MPFTTYTELRTAVATHLNRSDLTDAIVDFIALGESRLKRHEAIQYERRDSIVLNAETVSLPSDCREVKSLYFDDATRRGVIELRSPEELNPTRQGPLTPGVPTKAAIYANGSALLISPKPDQSYNAWLVYWATLTPLSATNPTNWLLTAYPDVYLFAALVAAEPYLKNDERMPLWKSQLDEALAEILALNERRQYGNTPILRPRLAIG